MLTAKEVALEVTKALDEKKGIDIKLLRIEKISSLADYFLICTGPRGPNGICMDTSHSQAPSC